MALTLRAVSLNDVALTQVISARFGDEGGTIGRSDDNTLVLPDPERYISRRHARIYRNGNAFEIQNVGSANAMMVCNRSLAQGESAALRHLEFVRIGGYVLEVACLPHDDPIHGSATERPRTAPDRGCSPPASTAKAWQSLSAENPFSALLGLDEPVESPAWRPTAQENGRRRLPDALSGTSRSEVNSLAGLSAHAGLVPETDLASIDELIGAHPNPASDPVDRFLADPPWARSAVDSSAAVAAYQAVRLSDRVPELLAAFKPLRAMPSPAATAPASGPIDALSAAQDKVGDPPLTAQLHPPREPASSGPVVEPAAAAALWHAFCSGAGIEFGMHPLPSLETMNRAGLLLRLAVEGTQRLMALRSTARYELRANVTMIRPRENNPLKFSPDARTALEALLLPAARGYLPGTAAMAGAMEELLAHQVGVMAGMRAALEGLLSRFAPNELETRLSADGVLDRLLPMTRRSRLWELYRQHHASIREAAQEDFHTLFGKAFLSAYEQHVERLHRGASAPSE